MLFKRHVISILWTSLLLTLTTAWIVNEKLSLCDDDPDVYNYCSSCFSVYFCSGFEIYCDAASEACLENGVVASCATSSEVPNCQCPSKVPSAFTDPYDPHKYFACLGGAPLPNECQNDFIFDEETNKCTEFLTTTMMPSTSLITVEPCDPDIYGLVPIDCTRYKVCLPGYPATEFSCDPGQIFNPDTNDCENYELFSCPPETGTQSVPDNLDCTKFHICSNGVEQGNSITCPSSTPVFNSDLQKCVGNDSVVWESCPTGCLPDIPSDVVCTNDITRYAIDCKSYFQCTNDGAGGFVPIRYDCPDPTVYNDVENYCDLPSNVPACQNLPQKLTPLNIFYNYINS